MTSFSLRLERRLTTNKWHASAIPVMSIVSALLVGAVFLFLEGFNPLTVYLDLFDASFTSKFGITDSLTAALPLIFTGLAAAFVFRMNLFNIGVEGQLYLGAICASWAALMMTDPTDSQGAMPTFFGVAIVLVVGSFGGAMWALPTALMKAYFGTSEIITTLMMTFIALFLMRYLVFGSKSFWRETSSTNFPKGKKIAEALRFETWGNTRLHWGLVVAVVVVILVWVIVRYTSFGFDMNVVGRSTASAEYAGIPVRRTIIFALLVSGALGGLAGATEVTGRAYALDPNGLELGLGFTGIVVAALARYNPFAVVLVAVFIGGLRNAGLALQGMSGQSVPAEVSLMLQGTILLFAIGGEVFASNRLVIVRANRRELA